MLISFGVFSAAGSGVSNSYELISTNILGSNQTNIGFTSIPQTYKHLQIRITGRSTYSGSYDNLAFYLNNDTGSNYSTHSIYNASPPASNAFTSNTRGYWPSLFPAGSYVANSFAAGVIDILDYTSTSKNKTMKSFIGGVTSGSGVVALISNAWYSTSAVTQINFETSVGILAGSRFSLYGIKG